MKLDQECQQGDSFAKGRFEDVYAVGMPEVVLPALVKFQQELKNRCGLDVQWNKTEWFLWEGELPNHDLPELKLTCLGIDRQIQRGFIC